MMGLFGCGGWMTRERQKLATNATSLVFFLLGGIEYAVILPTINEYVNSFYAGQLYLGLALSAFSLSGLLVSPFFGILHDKLRRTRGMLLFANFFEIGGNLMYFFAPSPDVIVLSRFISGIGSGVAASMIAQIARTTPEEERSAAFAQIMAVRQFGMLFGPALNLMFVAMDTQIGVYDLNDKTAPGLMMTLAWSLYQVMVVFLYRELPFLSDLAPDDEPAPKGNGVIKSGERETYDKVTDEHHGKGDKQERDDTVQRPPVERRRPSGNLTRKQKVMALLQEEIVVMLTVTLAFFFNQSSLEAAVTPLTKKLLDFGSLGNSLLFGASGFLIIFGYVLINIISTHIQDRVILTIGLMIEIISMIGLCVLLPIFFEVTNAAGDWVTWLWFICEISVQVFGLPFIFVTHVSLLSKLVPEEIQGSAQGLRRSVMGIGLIMGPLWATGLLEMPLAFCMIMLALFVLVQSMIFLSWGKLAEPGREEVSSNPGDEFGASEEPQVNIPLLELDEETDPED